MTVDAFRASLSSPEPPRGLKPAVQALWWDARGEWDRAHACVQDQDDQDAAWVHAYLHRKEGDLANASYWYRRAGRPMPQGKLDEEWASIATALASDG